MEERAKVVGEGVREVGGTDNTATEVEVGEGGVGRVGEGEGGTANTAIVVTSNNTIIARNKSDSHINICEKY